MVNEYKDFLFVKVPEDERIYQYSLISITEAGLSWLHFLDKYENDLPGQIELLGDNWQIIGKGDAIDWEGIITPAEITDPRGHQVTAKESGYFVLRLLGMEPGTTLILKQLK